MEKITKTIEKQITQYKAIDGTVFNSIEECQRYEDTVLCVVKSRLNIIETTFYDLVLGDEASIEIIESPNLDDVEMYLRLLFWISNDKREKSIQQWKNSISKNKCNKTLVIKNLDDDVFDVLTYTSFINRINSIVFPTNE